MRRKLFTESHEAFRERFTSFLQSEVVGDVGRYDEWERQGSIPRETFSRAGELGFLGMAVPEEFGGAGLDDFRFNLIIGEEAQRAGVGSFGVGMAVNNDTCVPYFMAYCDGDQQACWLPGIASGQSIIAIALTEPGAGSDLAGIETVAERNGDGFVINGVKTLISNGLNADLVLVGVRTAEGEGDLSLIVVERGVEGFRSDEKLAKIGQRAQDTATLSFTDVRVPAENLLGEEGEGFQYLALNLPRERLSIAAAAIAASEAALEMTVGQVKGRNAFGQALGSFQAVRLSLAELHSEVEVARTFVDRCVEGLNARELTIKDAAVAKWWCTELQGRVVDHCLQLNGGSGYLLDNPIGRAYVDARATRIYGGANEIMKEIVGRALGL